jgi:hypothetical protein
LGCRGLAGILVCGSGVRLSCAGAQLCSSAWRRGGAGVPAGSPEGGSPRCRVGFVPGGWARVRGVAGRVLWGLEEGGGGKEREGWGRGCVRPCRPPGLV